MTLRFNILCFGLLFVILSCSTKNKTLSSDEKCTKYFSLIKESDENNNQLKNFTQDEISYCKRQGTYNNALEYFSQKNSASNNSQNSDNTPLNPQIFDANILVEDGKQTQSKILTKLNQKIDLNISNEVSAEDLLFDISSNYDIDIQIMSDIEKGVVISVSDKKIIDIFKIIAKIANLRFSIENDSIIFEKDDPFVKNYILTLLDAIKTGSDSYGVGSGLSSSVASSSSNSSSSNGVVNQSSGGVTGSSQVSNTTEWSVWKSFDDGLKKILEKHKDSSFNINKQAGIITVNASTKGHKDVADYIEKIRRYAMTQILVELKIVELTLDNEYKTGVQFSSSSTSNNNANNNVSMPFALTTLTSGFFSAGFSKTGSTDIDSAINLLQKFGATKVVSSPRINVVNNQKAVLSFAQDKIYFQIQPTLQNQYTAVGGVTNPTTPIIINSTVKSVPVGIILSLQAAANPDNNEITLNVRPSLSSSNDSDSVEDPAALFLNNYTTTTTSTGAKISISNKVPVVKKKELDSVMKLQSGGIMVLGGFNEEVSEDVETGVPILMSIPLLGYLFKTKTKSVQNVETIIFVKASIIPSQSVDVLSTKDKVFYDIFT